MSKFSLNKLAKSLAEKSGLSQMEAELFVRKMFDVCNQGLVQDKQVKIKWLGTFKILQVKDRESVDVNTGERILIEGRDKISFTPDNILKEIINKPFAQFETVVVNDGVDFDVIDKMFDLQEGEAEVEEGLDDNSEENEAEEKVEETKPEVEVKNEEPKADLEETAEIIVLPDTPIKTIEQEKAEWRKALEEEKNSLEEEKTIEEEDPAEEHIEEQIEEEEKTVVEEQTVEVENTAEENNDAEDENVSESECTPTDESISENEIVVVEDSSKRQHLVIPRYLLIVACLVFVVLIAGIGWIAFSYGKMEAQRDRLAMELSEYRNAKAATTQKKAKPKAKPSVPSTPPPPETPEQTIQRKAREDSIRMAKASEVVEKVEEQQTEADQPKKKQEDAAKKKTVDASMQYDKDVRVRTGAYRIVGVSQTVKAKAGQSLSAISRTYLGPGMECYVEAINGTTTITPGQEVKIPKLELKKKKQK